MNNHELLEKNEFKNKDLRERIIAIDEELEAYAAEAELNLDDLQAEDIWSLSDFDDVDPPVPDAMQMD